jgi:adenylate cyclase
MKTHLHKLTSGALLGIISALIVLVLAQVLARNLMYSYEAQTYDWRVQKKIADVPAQSIEDIVIIDVDGRSVSKLGRFAQWPRSYYPRILNYLREGGALAVGLDILFDKDIWQPESDKEFIETVSSMNNIYNSLYFGDSDSLNWRHKMDQEPDGFDTPKFAYRLPNGHNFNFVTEERMENEFIELLNASAGLGHVNFQPDYDGVVRSIHLFSRFNKNLYPSLAFKMFLDLEGIDSVSTNKKDLFYLLQEGQKRYEIPVNPQGKMDINYFGPFKVFRYISFYDVLEKRIQAEYFRGKVVIIGSSLPGLFDLRSVPFLKTFPGVEIHANILYTLMQQLYITRTTMMQTLLIMVTIGVVLGIIISFLSPLWSIVLALLFAVGHVVVSAVIFFESNLWIDIITPVATIFFTFSLVYLYRFVTEEKNKRFIRTTFSHFVTKSVVDELLANPDKIKLGGERKVCTVLFSDVAGFTTISEQLTPESLVQLLNDYLSEMTNIIFQHDGMLDKYEGDAIMAVFGAPVSHGQDALNACISAIEMQEQLERMRNLWRKQGKPELFARIGINSGPMVVGNMGSDTRFDYTVMGDAVNLGARLEPANKEYGTSILIGEETKNQAGDRIVTRKLDLLRVKGKREPAKVYELIGLEDYNIPDNMMRVIDLFHSGFNNYITQDWDAAIYDFKKALEIKQDDGPSLRYLERCKMFRETPPGGDWDGVFTMKTKE